MWQLAICLGFTVVFHTQTVSSDVQDGLVSAPWGKIRGIPKTPLPGLSITSFEGIPYAKPPLGNLRFSKPVPSTGSHRKIFMADALKPSCLGFGQLAESEDCLYLDIYVPRSESASSLLPVMVFIHGGGFVVYPYDSRTKPLLMRKVITAVVHYRMGVMGFLSTGDEELKGNYGLWDQRMAIQWVKDNVAAFGGDPNSITVIGQSAGSASVAYQMLAPDSNDLFQRAILQSGCATSSWALSRHPARHAYDLGRKLGCVPASSSADLAKCLRGVDGDLIQKEMFALLRLTLASTCVIDLMFVPVVDHEFIVEEPLKLIKNASHLQSVGALDKDVVIGVVNNESIIWDYIIPSIPNAPEFGHLFATEIIPTMLRQRYGVTTTQAEEAVVSLYDKNLPQHLLNEYTVSDVINDIGFVIPALEFVDALSKSSTSGRRYLYYFDYCPSFHPVTCMGHGFDLIFLLNVDALHIDFSSADHRISDMYISLLATFAATGTPTAVGTPRWTPFSPDSHSYLKISAQPEVKQNLFPKRVKFWNTTMDSLIARLDLIN